jgi:hydroxyacylglutathione hydrolase
MSEHSGLYIRQLLTGRDHALINPVAGQMANHAYLVGCRSSGECLVVDPSWDPRGLVDLATADGMTVVGAIATHAHPDHIGGPMMGLPVPGLKELCQQVDGPVHAHPLEANAVKALSGLGDERLELHEDGDSFAIGEQAIEVLHCPGHTPGHIVLLVDGNLITGDVLFVGACGRTDLPGASPRQMFQSLQRLAQLPPETIVWPGHHYGSAPRSTIGDEIRTNPYIRMSEDDWSRMMG